MLILFPFCTPSSGGSIVRSQENNLEATVVDPNCHDVDPTQTFDNIKYSLLMR
jgi:hypothetical protein